METACACCSKQPDPTIYARQHPTLAAKSPGQPARPPAYVAKGDLHQHKANVWRFGIVVGSDSQEVVVDSRSQAVPVLFVSLRFCRAPHVSTAPPSRPDPIARGTTCSLPCNNVSKYPNAHSKVHNPAKVRAIDGTTCHTHPAMLWPAVRTLLTVSVDAQRLGCFRK